MMRNALGLLVKIPRERASSAARTKKKKKKMR